MLRAVGEVKAPAAGAGGTTALAALGVAFLLGVALVLLFLVLLAPAAALVAERFLVAEEAVPPLLGVLVALACFFSFRFSAHSLALRSASALFSALSARLCWAGVNFSFFLEAGVAFFLEAGVAFLAGVAFFLAGVTFLAGVAFLEAGVLRVTFLAAGVLRVALGGGVAAALALAAGDGEALGLRAGVLAAVGFFPDAAFLVAEAEIRTFLAVLLLRLAGAGVLLRLRPRLLVLGVLALAGVLLRLRPALAGVLLRLRPRGLLSIRLSDSPSPPDLPSRERVRPATVARRVPTILRLPFVCCVISR